MGELAAGGTAILWAMSAMLFTAGGRRAGAEPVNLIRLYFGMIFITITHWMLLGTPFDMNVESWRHGVLFVSALVGLVIGDGALFYAFVAIGARLSMLIMSLVPVFSAVFALFCFGEELQITEWLAILFSVFAIAFVVGEKRTEESDDRAISRSDFVRGIVCALIGVLGQTGNLIITKYALVDEFSTLTATEIRIFYSLLILTIWALFRGRLRIIFSTLKDYRFTGLVSAGAFVGPFVGIWLSYIAIVKTKVAIASVIMATPPLLLIPLSAFFFKEKITLRSTLGTALAFIGIASLIWLQSYESSKATSTDDAMEKTQSLETQDVSSALGLLKQNRRISL